MPLRIGAAEHVREHGRFRTRSPRALDQSKSGAGPMKCFDIRVIAPPDVDDEYDRLCKVVADLNKGAAKAKPLA